MAIDLSKRDRGRPSKLTDAVWQTLIDNVKKNNYVSVCCMAAGISHTTLSNWMSHAKDCEEYLTHNNIELPDTWNEVTDNIIEKFPEVLQDKLIYWYLFADLKRAEAQGIIDLSANVSDAAPKNWLAAMTLLERRHPDMYGKRDAVDINVQEGTELLNRLATILQKKGQPVLNSGK